MPVTYEDMVAQGWTKVDLARFYPALSPAGSPPDPFAVASAVIAPAVVHPKAQPGPTTTVYQAAGAKGYDVPYGRRGEFAAGGIQTGVPGIIGGVIGLGSALGIGGGTLATLGAVAAAGYGIYQAVGGGGGGGGVTSGGGSAMTKNNYGIGGGVMDALGIGVPEPADGTWEKRWNIAVNSVKFGGTWRVYFWKMWDGYTLCYNPRTGGWKRYKPRRNIVLSSDPRISNIARAERAVQGKLRRLAKKSKTLKLAK